MKLKIEIQSASAVSFDVELRRAPGATPSTETLSSDRGSEGGPTEAATSHGRHEPVDLCSHRQRGPSLWTRWRYCGLWVTKPAPPVVAYPSKLHGRTNPKFL